MNERMAALLEWAEDSVKNIFSNVTRERDKNFVMTGMCLGLNKYDEPFMCPMDFADENDRRLKIARLKTNLCIQEVTEYVVIQEAWCAKALPGETADNHVMPKDREDRTEGVVLIAASRLGEKMFRFFAISRDAEGVPSIGEVERPDYDGLGGALACLFDGMPEPPPEAVAMVRGLKAKMLAGHVEGFDSDGLNVVRVSPDELQIESAVTPQTEIEKTATYVPTHSRYMN